MKPNPTPEPTRWKDGGGALPSVPEAMRLLGSQRASAAETERLAVRLSAQLAAPTRSAGTHGPSSPHARRLGQHLPWVGVALLGAVMGWLALPKAPTSAPLPVEPLRHAAPEVARRQPASRSATPGPQPALPPAAAVLPAARRSPAALDVRSHAKPSPPQRATHTAEDELLLLRNAQSALNRSASAALPILDQHAARYPDGAFTQEREMLRIEAELLLGQRALALARADRFAQRFPASTYHARVDALLVKHAASKNRENATSEATQ